MARFEKHRILITGAGAGIGALMAEEFAARGAEVIVTARRISAAREVADRIKAAGGRAHPYVLDVSKIASIAKLQAASGSRPHHQPDQQCRRGVRR